MHSYLYVSNNQNILQQSVNNYAKKISARVIEFQAHTIDEIREIKHFVNMAYHENMIIYLPQFDQASEAAQNALLKSLEEPQEHVYFVLTAKNEDAVLETIRSRCEVVYVQSPTNDANVQRYIDFVAQEDGGLFSIISNLKKREDAVEFLEAFIEGGRSKLAEDLAIGQQVKFAQLALNSIEKNGNVQIHLTHFLSQYLTCSEAPAKVQ